MPFPASLAMANLTGTFETMPDGTPRQGTVIVTLPTPIRSEGDNVIIPPFDFDEELDEDGGFSISLPTLTDPQWLPNTAAYIVQVVFTDDYRKLWWTVPLPYDVAGATLDLADVGAPNVGTPSLTIRQGTTQPLADGGYRAVWAGGTLYRAGDTVQYGSAVYGALKASTGVTPGTNAAVWKAYPGGGGGGGAVDSVFGRTGDVVAEAGDYTIEDITGLTAVLVEINEDLALKADASALTGKANLAGGAAFTGVVSVGGQAVVVTNDARLTDSRTPTAHAASHAAAGSDPVTVTQGQVTGLTADLAAKAPINNPTFTGTVGGVTKGMVGLGNVDNTADADKPVSTATQTALDGKAASVHTHAAGDVISGTFAIGRIPTGTSGTTVPLGNDARFSDTRTPTDGSVTTAKIVDGNVTLAKLASIAAATILGNNTGGAATPIALTAAQVKTLLAISTGDISGLGAALATLQPLDADLTTIAGLAATTDNIIQSVAGAWASRTPSQVKTALAIAQSDVSGLTAALALLAPLASPALTGTATAINLTMSGRQLNTPVALTDASTIAVNAALGNDFTVTLGGNRTLGNPTNPVNGQKIMFAIRQDGTGTRTLALDTAYRLGADISSTTLTTTAGKTDYLGVRYNGTDSKWDVIAFVKGY